MFGMTFRSDDRALLDLPYRHNTAAMAGGYRYAPWENHHLLLNTTGIKDPQRGQQNLPMRQMKL